MQPAAGAPAPDKKNVAAAILVFDRVRMRVMEDVSLRKATSS